jgi:CHAT domain-containing protein/tetratricopeptide (TPR) repeat protein
MSARAGAADNKKNDLRIRAIRILFSFAVASLAGCGGGYQTEPLVEYSTEVVVTGAAPHKLTRYLARGAWLVEVRERDIDLRVGIDAGATHTELADAFMRHGLHRAVVRLDATTRVDLVLGSVDVRGWKGAAAVRILRWPARAPGTPPDHRLLGFESLGQGSELVARNTPQSWRAALEPLRAAERHFELARDLQSWAETEYQRAWVELGLLFEYDAARATAQSALAHFRAAGDENGAQRTEVLLALGEFGSAGRMGPEVSRARQRALLDGAAQRAVEAQIYFETHDMPSDSLRALGAAQMRNQVLGRIENSAPVFEDIRRRAQARGDHYFEASATQSLGYIAQRQGDVVRAVALYENVLPLVDPERNPELYASLISNLGFALIALGEFDRALVLHTQALGMFSAQGNSSQTARELVALAAIQFRSGDLERSLASVEGALPLFDSAQDQLGLASALRLAGNAAAQLGRHTDALRYLRAAEHTDANGINVDRTRVLIAGELGTLGWLGGAEELIARVLPTTNQSTRADALMERALLRQRQHRDTEALADLREADAIYARLRLDFRRIDSSSALAMALLDAGDVHGASEAADVAVGMERRIRIKAANPETRARFLSASYAPYEARIEADFAEAPQGTAAAWRAFRTAETIRARSLSDRLAHAARGARARPDGVVERLRGALTALQLELEASGRQGAGAADALLELRRRVDETQAQLGSRQLSQDGVDASAEPRLPESLAAVQDAIPADTAVLAYFVGDRRSHAWLLTRTELRHAALPGRQALAETVSDFIDRQRGELAMPLDGRFASLTGGLLNGLRASRLLVIPDGPLNGLPFAALPYGRTATSVLLVDRFEITMAPSLALVLRPQAPRTTPNMRVAIVSDPVYTPDDRRLSAAAGNASRFRGRDETSEGLARLPYSAIEARAVKRAFASAHIIELTGFDATAHRVAELPTRDLNVLHFATHAVVRRDAPELSALFLSEYAADGSPVPADRLTVDDITRSGLRADVVVLSGCATGDGPELRGEGVLGLTYGFLANGSNAVISTLWPVEDALTARFMEQFYAAYRLTGRVPEALRIAQLRTRDTDGAMVWSSFVVRASAFP